MSAENTNAEQGKTLRIVVGRVVSDARDKTITVAVERRMKHPLYGKYLRKTDKIQAHDEDNSSKVGDLVSIAACRPISRTKAWRFVEVLESAVEA